MLPLKGFYYFRIVLVEAFEAEKSNSEGRQKTPFMELGIKNDEGDRETIKLQSG